jgi:acetylxylan esterase
MTPVASEGRRGRPLLAAAAVLALALSAPGPARAASLVQVTGFGTNPTSLAMYLYVPDSLAARPGLLLALHYCTGTGPAFFSGTEFRSLADRYGFIVIYPSATRSGQCWDVSSAAALKRNGGSDPVGLMSMISYVEQHYPVDTGRVYVTGASSGAMMTNVMLGDYPDVFKAGAAFMGVPFGCFATTDGSSWNSQCANGQISKTPAQWGDLVRAAYAYSGARPRMQLFHGTTDSTLNYNNFGEEVKQWTNVLGVSQTPSLTDTPQSGWTRTRYGGTGVQAPVEGVSVAGVGHSLPLSGQAAMAIAFFGLDQTNPTTSYALTVTRSGTGSGTVTSSTGGISCGATCSATIASGTAVTLTATAAAGSTFAGWSGACVGSGSCVVTMTAAQSVGAAFGTSGGTTYPLTVTRSGTGSGTVTSSTGGISCGAACSATIASGTAVTLTATAAAGSTFAGWSGACVGSGACVVTMTAAQSVGAAFNASGGGTGTVSINAGGPATGSFVADTGSSGGSTYTTTNAIDTSLLTGAVPPAAVFQTERYGEFTYTIPGLTAGSAQTVTLYFEESYWTAAGQRTFNVAINGTTVLSAFDIFAAAGGANKAIARTFGTTASSGGQVVIQFTRNGADQPKICGLTVAAGGGGGGTSYALSVGKAGTGSGTVTGAGISCGTTCSASFASGTGVTLTAAAASGSTFAGWSGACVGTSATCTVSMTAAQSVTATFNASGGGGGTCKTPAGTGQSGNFGTTDAVCYTVGGTINGWGCSNTTGRTVSVNGTAVTCGQMPLPGSSPYTFSFSAGSYTWASFYWW